MQLTKKDYIRDQIKSGMIRHPYKKDFPSEKYRRLKQKGTFLFQEGIEEINDDDDSEPESGQDFFIGQPACCWDCASNGRQEGHDDCLEISAMERSVFNRGEIVPFNRNGKWIWVAI
ncbi:MAG: hypothetical protein ABIG69_06930 [Bacteroidota bacterium]